MWGFLTVGRRATLIAGFAAISLVTQVSPAAAVAPGVNGPIFFSGSGEIYRIDPDGTDQTNLTMTAGGEERPSARADGSRVAFQAFDADSWEIFRIDGGGGNRTQLTHTGTNFVNFEPGYSPDGTDILFMRQSPPDAGLSFPGAQDLWRISPSGTGETDLTNTPYASDGTHSDECCGEYSPDGTKIVYANGFNSDPLEAESNDIWVMNANGSNQHALTGPHDYPIQDVGPSWSPDGTKIVFSRTSTGNGSDGLYLIDSDGTDLTPIMNGAAQVAGNSPTFSPDGTLIAFSNGSRIVTVPPAGGAPVPVTPLGTSPDYPSWSGGGGSSDTTAPQTTITSGPPAMTKLRNVKLGFTSSENGSHFQCKLDGASAFTACSSPKSYSGLGDGKHSFRVRAIDAAANVDPTPATRTFTVDATPPKTTITSGPSGKIRSHRAKFGFASSEPGSHFQCRLDGGAYAPCTSPAKYKGLKHGRHTFKVRAIDKLGNVDATAASRSFKVKR